MRTPPIVGRLVGRYRTGAGAALIHPRGGFFGSGFFGGFWVFDPTAGKKKKNRRFDTK